LDAQTNSSLLQWMHQSFLAKLLAKSSVVLVLLPAPSTRDVDLLCCFWAAAADRQWMLLRWVGNWLMSTPPPTELADGWWHNSCAEKELPKTDSARGPCQLLRMQCSVLVWLSTAYRSLLCWSSSAAYWLQPCATVSIPATAEHCLLSE